MFQRFFFFLHHVTVHTIFTIQMYIRSRIRNVCKAHSAKNTIDGIKVNATIIVTVHLLTVALSIYGGVFLQEFFAKTVRGKQTARTQKLFKVNGRRLRRYIYVRTSHNTLRWHTPVRTRYNF